jgi:transposase
MMGRQAVSEQLFYDFRLEDHVPEKHLLRQLDKVLRFDSIRAALSSYYSHTGRPSIDPELMLRMMLVGYAYGIRSDRRLCEEVHLNLAYRWFCRLGLDGRIPDQSTFSKNRYGRFQESGIYRTLFEEVVSQCQGAGLVGGEGFAVDGTLITANVNYAKQVASVEELRSAVHPASVSRPVRAYLDALDAALPEGDKEAFRPARLSVRDPQAAWSQKYKHAGFGYYSNYLIDTQHAVIVGVEATPALSSQEVVAARAMLERAEKEHGLKPRRLAADKLYGSGHFLFWLFGRNVEPHIPVIDRTAQVKGILTRDDFAYDADTDTFTCPEGKTLAPSRHHPTGVTILRAPMIAKAAPGKCSARRGQPMCAVCRGTKMRMCPTRLTPWHRPRRIRVPAVSAKKWRCCSHTSSSSSASAASSCAACQAQRRSSCLPPRCRICGGLFDCDRPMH